MLCSKRRYCRSKVPPPACWSAELRSTGRDLMRMRRPESNRLADCPLLPPLIRRRVFCLPSHDSRKPPTRTRANDSNVVVVEEPNILAKGQRGTWWDDFKAAISAGLLITVTERRHCFYILIDRAAENRPVHFLNQVDEADLMALTETRGSHEKAGSLQLYGKMWSRKGKYVLPGSCAATLDRLHRQEPTQPQPSSRKEPKEKGGNHGAVLALVLFVLLVAARRSTTFKFVKPKQNVKGDTDLEDFWIWGLRRGRAGSRYRGNFERWRNGGRNPMTCLPTIPLKRWWYRNRNGGVIMRRSFLSPGFVLPAPYMRQSPCVLNKKNKR